MLVVDVKHQSRCIDDDFRSTASEIRLYKRPRGDKLLSIKHLSKWAKAGDTVVFKHDPTINPAVHPMSNDRPIRMNVRKGEAA